MHSVIILLQKIYVESCAYALDVYLYIFTIALRSEAVLHPTSMIVIFKYLNSQQSPCDMYVAAENAGRLVPGPHILGAELAVVLCL